MTGVPVEERLKQLREETDRRRRRLDEQDRALRAAEELKAKEALERRRLERQADDERMRKPWQQPEAPRKPILRAGQRHKPPPPRPTASSRLDASPASDQRRNESERVRREWRDGLRAHIQAARSSVVQAPQLHSQHMEQQAVGEPTLPEALTWSELKLAAQAGFEELLQQQATQACGAGGVDAQRGRGHHRSPHRAPPRGQAPHPGTEPTPVRLRPAAPTEAPTQHADDTAHERDNPDASGHGATATHSVDPERPPPQPGQAAEPGGLGTVPPQLLSGAAGDVSFAIEASAVEVDEAPQELCHHGCEGSPADLVQFSSPTVSSGAAWLPEAAIDSPDVGQQLLVALDVGATAGDGSSGTPTPWLQSSLAEAVVAAVEEAAVQSTTQQPNAALLATTPTSLASPAAQEASSRPTSSPDRTIPNMGSATYDVQPALPASPPVAQHSPAVEPERQASPNLAVEEQLKVQAGTEEGDTGDDQDGGFHAAMAEVRHLSALRRALRAEFAALGQEHVASALASLDHTALGDSGLTALLLPPVQPPPRPPRLEVLQDKATGPLHLHAVLESATQPADLLAPVKAVSVVAAFDELIAAVSASSAPAPFEAQPEPVEGHASSLAPSWARPPEGEAIVAAVAAEAPSVLLPTPPTAQPPLPPEPELQRPALPGPSVAVPQQQRAPAPVQPPAPLLQWHIPAHRPSAVPGALPPIGPSLSPAIQHPEPQPPVLPPTHPTALPNPQPPMLPPQLPLQHGPLLLGPDVLRQHSNPLYNLSDTATSSLAAPGHTGPSVPSFPVTIIPPPPFPAPAQPSLGYSPKLQAAMTGTGSEPRAPPVLRARSAARPRPSPQHQPEPAPAERPQMLEGSYVQVAAEARARAQRELQHRQALAAAVAAQKAEAAAAAAACPPRQSDAERATVTLGSYAQPPPHARATAAQRAAVAAAAAAVSAAHNAKQAYGASAPVSGTATPFPVPAIGVLSEPQTPGAVAQGARGARSHRQLLQPPAVESSASDLDKVLAGMHDVDAALEDLDDFLEHASVSDGGSSSERLRQKRNAPVHAQRKALQAPGRLKLPAPSAAPSSAVATPASGASRQAPSVVAARRAAAGSPRGPAVPYTSFAAAVRGLIGLPGTAPLAAAQAPVASPARPGYARRTKRPVPPTAPQLSAEEAAVLSSLQRIDRTILDRVLTRLEVGSTPAAAPPQIPVPALKQQKGVGGKLLAQRPPPEVTTSQQAALLQDSLDRLDARLAALNAKVVGRAAGPTQPAPAQGSKMPAATASPARPLARPHLPGGSGGPSGGTPNRAKALRDARQAHMVAAAAAGPPTGAGALPSRLPSLARRQASAGARVEGPALVGALPAAAPRQFSAPVQPAGSHPHHLVPTLHRGPGTLGAHWGGAAGAPPPQHQAAPPRQTAWAPAPAPPPAPDMTITLSPHTGLRACPPPAPGGMHRAWDQQGMLYPQVEALLPGAYSVQPAPLPPAAWLQPPTGWGVHTQQPSFAHAPPPRHPHHSHYPPVGLYSFHDHAGLPYGAPQQEQQQPLQGLGPRTPGGMGLTFAPALHPGHPHPPQQQVGGAGWWGGGEQAVPSSQPAPAVAPPLLARGGPCRDGPGDGSGTIKSYNLGVLLG